MNVQNIGFLLNHRCNVFKSIQKICVANSYLPITKGIRKVAKARKYKRPEDLEDPYYYGVGPKKKVEHVYDSLRARGFAKELKSYTPPADVEEQLHNICKKIFGSGLNEDWKSQSLSDRVLKFKLLTKAIQAFGKDIPSSQLHKMEEIKDLLEYLSTSVDGSYHYDALMRDSDKLPPNLHVMPDTPLFNPVTDTFFDGVTAFSGRRRIVFSKNREKWEKIIEWPNI